MEHGFVALVGAGPGDKGLITIRGAELLSQADVVVYDRLVSQEIIKMIPTTAEKIDVGKENKFHPVKQEEINHILLEKSLEGKKVIRLKGGDPFVFGRGGEELELLYENNIPFEVVPGVTSAVAALCYGGIPATHRDFCSSLHIITGHAREGGQLSIPFHELKELNGTIVFLMGDSSLSYLMNGLINAGMEKDMPAAIVENGTRPNQRKLVATVGTLEQKALEMEIKSPAIIAVGKVCSLSEKFSWFMKKPLFGTKILVTRPKESSGTLVEKLRQLGAEPVEYPCIEVVPIPQNEKLYHACENIREYGWILLTSKNGIQIFFDYLNSKGLDARVLANTKIGTVGSQTAKALKEVGLISDFTPEIFDGRHLALGIAERVGENEKVLICDAAIASDDIVNILRSNNIKFDRVPLYNTNYINENSNKVKKSIVHGELKYITFTSASTVEGFIASMKDIPLESLTAVCIGNKTAEAAKKYNLRYVVAEKSTIDSMIDKLLEIGGGNIYD
uniref:Porphyrin biosynthesis protein HemD n=1 Tax=Ruminiclostridium josui TaxID=1499 RepID=HEM4_RUMJO|nr:RecName: Full=Porphyrin biosynthesis protein HemD; Includes: RecName: Full=Uroporphyrinogen-III C-methyltransferase; Short=Urogen III methylase; AltName: Full=SUMT; AltName: Full=Uroporphyrinogen III methylase; Short=UROM; Includes: RecName: Full=Uroporphyrinogen-III synthase; Short=UROS; AltName: Full=Hydroxymethylbilane hydrolyase [cyclizing]; AltName: Full=Uroporphyrinogen-III cosynthase [Ruminiclostridium josui]BAA05862.1 uroporphyrinogen-III synthase [Ruminiclostridium josui]